MDGKAILNLHPPSYKCTHVPQQKLASSFWDKMPEPGTLTGTGPRTGTGTEKHSAAAPASTQFGRGSRSSSFPWIARTRQVYAVPAITDLCTEQELNILSQLYWSIFGQASN